MTDPSVAAEPRPTVAVIGAGVSGLTAAYLLQPTHHVTLFEADDRLGGHAHTHDVELSDGASVPVDSGFIVLNDRTYPMLRRLFGELGVQTRPTEMSMSITCEGCGLSYKGGTGANGIFATAPAAARPAVLAAAAAASGGSRRRRSRCSTGRPTPTSPTASSSSAQGFDAHFVTHYALPVVSCVWSMGHQ